MRRVLVVSVHPDDETLGCGGTLLKHQNAGDEIFWLIITNVKEEYGYSQARVIIRNLEIDAVSKEYNFNKVVKLEFQPTKLNSENQPDLITKISKVFCEIKPEIIYLINRSDAHSDHRFAFSACYACTKAFRHPYIQKILMYECLSETEFAAQLPENVFIPNYFVDITEFIDKKIEIMGIYASEIEEHPFPRSIQNIRALASYRGASCGKHYAEAFQLLKYIEN